MIRRGFSFLNVVIISMSVAMTFLVFASGATSKQTFFDAFDKMIFAERYQEAISISKKIEPLSLSTEEKYQLSLKRGICFYSLWDITNAESSFTSALALSSSTSQPDLKKEEVVFHLGELYYSSRNYPKALEYLEQLQARYNSKSYPDYLYYLGKTYVELKIHSKAKVCFDTISASFSSHPKAVLTKNLCASLPKQ